VAGSELAFVDRGVHELRGVPAEWRVYELAWGRSGETGRRARAARARATASGWPGTGRRS